MVMEKSGLDYPESENKMKEILLSLPELYGKAIVRVLSEDIPAKTSQKKGRAKRYGNPLWLTLLVWIGYPLFIAGLMALVIILSGQVF